MTFVLRLQIPAVSFLAVEANPRTDVFDTTTKFVPLGCIAPFGEVCKTLGIGEKIRREIKRRGMPIITIGQKEYVNTDTFNQFLRDNYAGQTA